MYRVFGLTIFILLVAAFAGAQDLGSSNKLFGKPKSDKAPASVVKKASPKPRRVSSRPKATPKPKTTAKTKSTVPAAAKAVESATLAKGQPAVKPSTAAKIPGKTESIKTESLSAEKIEKLITEGNEARQRGDDAAAEETYRTALKAAPDYTYVKLALSELLSRPVAVEDLFDRYDEAATLAAAAVEKEPSNAVAQDRLGVAMEVRGSTGPQTEAAYRRAISLDPTYAPAYAHLGRLLRRRGDQSGATKAYADAISRARDAATLISIAATMHSEQRFAESIEILDRAVAMEPRNSEALDLLGTALAATGQIDDAEKTLRKSIEVDPQNARSYLRLSALFLRKGDLGSAENFLMRGAKFATGFQRLKVAGQFEQLGDAYAKNDMRAQATRSYKQALTFAPERESVLAKLSAKK